MRRALSTIDEASFRKDLTKLVGLRNANDPEHARAALFYVEDELRAAGFAVQRQLVRREDHGEVNVIADLAGREVSSRERRNRVVVATAHLDTVSASPGADDNASGIATLLAIARAAKTIPTASSIRLIAFGLEEEGLAGSKRYVRSLSATERARIDVVYNFDMVAYRRHSPGSQEWPEHADILADLKGRPLPTTGSFIGAVTIASEDHAPIHALHEAQAFVPRLRVETLELPPVLLRFTPDLTRGDHAPFWKVGIPAVAIGDTAELRNPHYHMPSDTLVTLDLAFGAEVARWGAAGVLIAARPL